MIRIALARDYNGAMSGGRNQTTAYSGAGVDVALGNQVKSGIQRKISQTHGPEVLGKLGGFGGFFRAGICRRMNDPVLVSSIDGVGTKLKIAFMTGRHESVGRDLVNHCVNDIAVTGAKPLFFLDYLGTANLDPAVAAGIIEGLAGACREAGCALIGGETAQMPDLYSAGEYDLAGCIVGVVERARIIDGSRIRVGDVVLGLPSNGLHTNGYSLARKVFFDKMKLTPESRVKGLRGRLGSELLRVHANYQPALAGLGRSLKGAAHITGGGLIDNIPRILPAGVDARIELSSWRPPTIFRVLESEGGIARSEMYHVFNMGIGMVVVVSPRAAERAAASAGAMRIGRIVEGSGVVQLV